MSESLMSLLLQNQCVDTNTTQRLLVRGTLKGRMRHIRRGLVSCDVLILDRLKVIDTQEPNNCHAVNWCFSCVCLCVSVKASRTRQDIKGSLSLTNSFQSLPLIAPLNSLLSSFYGPQLTSLSSLYNAPIKSSFFFSARGMCATVHACRARASVCICVCVRST